MNNKQMPSKEILEQFGYSEEELHEYLDMLENQDVKHSYKGIKCTCNHKEHNPKHNHVNGTKDCNCQNDSIDCNCGAKHNSGDHCNCTEECDCDDGSNCQKDSYEDYNGEDCNCVGNCCHGTHTDEIGRKDNAECSCDHTDAQKPKLVKMCVLEDGVRCNNCGACNMCDLDPNKVCDNCGKCLDELTTDEKGYVHVPIDKIILNNDDAELDALLAAYGLSDDEEDE